MLPFSRRAPPRHPGHDDPYGARAPRGSLPPAFASTSHTPFQRTAQPQPGYGFPQGPPSYRDVRGPASNVELAPEVHADARRFGTPHPPHSLSPVAMGAHSASSTGPNLTQTISNRRPSMTGGIAILLAGVVAGGSFGIVMKAQQDRPDHASVAASRGADPAAAEAAAHGPVGIAQPPAQAPTQVVGVPNTVAPAMPGLTLAPIQAPQEAPVATAPAVNPRGGVVAAGRGRLATGRGAAARTAAPPPPPRHAEAPAPPPARPAKAETAPAPAAGGIRTVKIQAPASEPPVKEAPPAKEAAREAPAKETKEAPAKEPKPSKPAGKRDTKSTDDLLEEAIKNTSNVL